MSQLFFSCQLPRLMEAPPQGTRAPGNRGTGRQTSRHVVCMAHPRRVVKVAKQIEREIGQLLIHDKVLQQAICPERRSGFEGALSAVAGVTEVQLSNDLQVAKVYISVYSDDMGRAVAMQGLRKLEGYVRRHVGRQVRLRLTPEIRFIMDDSIERIDRVDRLLKQMEQIRIGAAEPPPIAIAAWDDEGEGGKGYSDDEDSAPAGSAAAAGIGQVDLGFFGGEEEEFAGRVRRGRARATGGRQQRGGAAAGASKGTGEGKRGAAASGVEEGFFADLEGDEGEMSEEALEEMLQYFKQQRRSEEETRNVQKGGQA